MHPTKAALLTEQQAQIAQKVKQAKETENRKNACSPKLRRDLSLLSPAASPWRSLERHGRLQNAPRSGPKAPAAPSCPALGAKSTKHIVPRDKVKIKPMPAAKPRVASRTPKPNPPAPKKIAKRPASRPRRQPGKTAVKKRIAPKQQQRKVARPPTNARGTERPRRR